MDLQDHLQNRITDIRIIEEPFSIENLLIECYEIFEYQFKVKKLNFLTKLDTRIAGLTPTVSNDP